MKIIVLKGKKYTFVVSGDACVLQQASVLGEAFPLGWERRKTTSWGKRCFPLLIPPQGLVF